MRQRTNKLTGPRGYHPVDARHDDLEERDEFAVVLWANIQSANLGQAFESDVAVILNFEELHFGELIFRGQRRFQLTLETR